jgi:hypothetical protein
LNLRVLRVLRGNVLGRYALVDERAGDLLECRLKLLIVASENRNGDAIRDQALASESFSKVGS